MRTLHLPLLAALLSLGCSPPADPSAEIAPTARACARNAQRCRLPGGALGVCQRLTEAERFSCTPQH